MKFSPFIQKIIAVLVVTLWAGIAHAQVEPVNEDPAPEVTIEQQEAAPDAFYNPAAHLDTKPWQLGMRLPAGPVHERLYTFHDYILLLITAVTVMVLVLLVYVCIRFSEKNNPKPSKTTHNVLIEVVWTLVPVLILVIVAIPSLRLLYYMDHTHLQGEADVTIKVIGYQWYWNYEYPDDGFAFDSYMIRDEDLQPGQPRLLAVDNPIYVPVGKRVRLQITAGDVIHSWAMPNFGVKMDAVPGRLNETWFQADIEGTYYGQCSELCGVNHGFMPIAVNVVSQEEYDAWIEEARDRFASSGDYPVLASIR